MQRRWLRLGMAAAVIVVDVLLGGWISWWHLVCWPTLLAVVLVTITEGLTFGSIGAVVTGLFVDSLSAVPHPVHTVGFLVASMTAWMVTRRVVTSRSTISLLTAVAIGTVTYGVAAGGANWLFSLVVRDQVHLQWRAIVVATIGQSVVHPMVVWLMWRMLGRGRYERLSRSLTETY